MPIDLSHFLDGEKPKGKAHDRDLSDLKEPKIPEGHIYCTQCSGTGEHIHTVRPIVPLTEKQEEINPNLMGVPAHSEKIKCIRCRGTGFVLPPTREIPTHVVQWWSRYKCTCGRTYEAPTFHNAITIAYTIHKPILRKGHVVGWRFSETSFRPADNFEGSTLPYEIKYHDVPLRACRKCAVSHLVITLPAPEEQSCAS